MGCSVIAVLFHFLICALFALRVNSSQPPAAWISHYCTLVFYQDWKLFVPPPKTNYALLVKIPGEGTVDILAEMRWQHQQNRFAGKGHRLLSFINYLHYFEANSKPNPGAVVNNAYFALLQKACVNYVNQSRQLSLSTLPLIVYCKPVGKIPPYVYYSLPYK